MRGEVRPAPRGRKKPKYLRAPLAVQWDFVPRVDNEDADVPEAPLVEPWRCIACTERARRWQMRCPNCGAEYGLVQMEAEGEDIPPPPVPLPAPSPEVGLHPSDIAVAEERRITTGYEGLDLVLGGGLVVGNSALLAGEPGAGKSTLAMCMLQHAAAKRPLYVGAEMSPVQMASLCKRVGAMRKDLRIAVRHDVDDAIKVAEKAKADLVAFDSANYLMTQAVRGQSGNPNQLKAVVGRIHDWAHAKGVPVIILSHVDKGGDIAGPHMVQFAVDVTLLLAVRRGGKRRVTARKSRQGLDRGAHAAWFQFHESGPPAEIPAPAPPSRPEQAPPEGVEVRTHKRMPPI